MRQAKYWKYLLAACAVILCLGLVIDSGNVRAAEADEDGFLIEDGILVHYSGTDARVVIPDGVTGIGPEAFTRNKRLSSVSIPESVTSIGREAFYSCGRLVSVNIPSGVTSIGAEAFRGCSMLTEVDISEGVEGIESQAFAECTALRKLDIPSGMTSIGEAAFAGCTGLREVCISDSVENIGKSAFAGCSSLTRIEIPKNVAKIEWGTFYECDSLTEVCVSDGVTSIGENAFSGCSSLTEINIPDSVGDIGGGAFSGCGNLAEVKLSDSLKNIEDEVFASCRSLENVRIPDGVTSIGEEAFYGCSSLKSVRIPDSVLWIESGTFFGCSSLVQVEIPEGVTMIGGNAFMNCNSLKGVSIPGSVVEIGMGAFMNCNSLESVSIPNSVVKIGGYAFSNCPGLTIYGTGDSYAYEFANEYDIPFSTERMPPYGFKIRDGVLESYYGDETDVIIPEWVTEIGAWAFDNCDGVISVRIPASVREIEEFAFSWCGSIAEIAVDSGSADFSSHDGLLYNKDGSKLLYCPQGKTGTVAVPEGVTVIGDRAFQECRKLTGIGIPKSVTEIGGYVFAGCYSLRRFHIPANVTDIGECPFGFCGSLTEITADPDHPLFVSIDGILYSRDGTVLCCCPGGKEGNIKIPATVKRIAGYAFFGCSGLDSIVLPDGLERIDVYAFSGCDGLTDMSIPDHVTSINWRAFYSSGSLTGVTIPASVTAIGPEAFSYCSEDLVLTVFKGSRAETYAMSNGIAYRYADGSSSDGNPPESCNDPSQDGTSQIDISKAAVTPEKESYAYDGKAKTPSVVVKLDGKTLILNTDYTVSYSDNVNVGTAKVTVTGIGSYKGSVTKEFSISKAGQGIVCKNMVYNVAYGAKPFTIQASADSELTYESSDGKVASVDKKGNVTIKGMGIAYITVRAGYDSLKVTVKVSPKKQTVTSVQTVKGRKLAVKWKKDKMATGYQAQISISRNFKKVLKTIKVSKNACTFTKLKVGNRYYVRLRSYKKCGKNMLYGAWSSPKRSSKVKK